MNDTIFEWSDRLATGQPAIDSEHRELLRLINELAQLHRKAADTVTLAGVFKGLCDYAVFHFANEDELMRRGRVDAQHVDEHRRAHSAFVSCLDQARRLLEDKPLDVVHHLLAFLVQWLVHHITGVDAELVRLLGGRTDRAGDGETRALDRALVETVNNLYERVGTRTFELLELNQQLEQAVERSRRSEEALRRSQARYAALVRYAPVALWELDAADTWRTDPGAAGDRDLLTRASRLRLVDVNDAALRQAGARSLDELKQRPLERWFDPAALQPFERASAALARGQPFECEVALRRDDGSRLNLAVNLFPLASGSDDAGRVIAASLDITGIRQAEERMRQLAMHDPLTELPNRLLFSDRLQQALRSCRRAGQRLALAFVDLDRFKPVNDTLGHGVGDQLLQQVAKRLVAAVRESDTAARIGGDEFVVLLHDVADGEAALAVAHKVHASLRLPFVLGAQEVNISSSIGVALYPDHGQDELSLSRRADAAMYQAKAAGRDSVRLWAPATDAGAD